MITYRSGAGASGGIGGLGGLGGGGGGGVRGPAIGVTLVQGGVASFGEPGKVEVAIGTAGLGGSGARAPSTARLPRRPGGREVTY